MLLSALRVQGRLPQRITLTEVKTKYYHSLKLFGYYEKISKDTYYGKHHDTRRSHKMDSVEYRLFLSKY